MIPLRQQKPLSDTGDRPNSSMPINANFVGKFILADFPDQNQGAMCELKKWATKLYDLLEKAPDLCDAMLSRQIDEDHFDEFYLDYDNHVWLRRFNNGLEDLIKSSDIQNLLARIIEGEE